MDLLWVGVIVMWIIKQTSTGLFWSNRFGWTGQARDAEKFTSAEACSVSLPMEGEWCRGSEKDAA